MLSQTKVLVASTAVLYAKFLVTTTIQGSKRFVTGTRPPEDQLLKGVPATKTAFGFNAGGASSAAATEADLRWQRIVQNDLENIPLGLLVAWSAVHSGGSELVNIAAIGTFTAARVYHTYAFAKGLQPHRSRAWVLGTAGVLALALNIRRTSALVLHPPRALSMSTKAPRILCTDPIHPSGVDFLRNRGYVVDTTSLSPAELVDAIPAYDGLIVRSGTQVNREVLDAAEKLRVIGRAGTGVDNIDVVAATKKGILVMNTPFGNNVSAAEFTMGLLTSFNHSVISGVHGKTVGIVGLGRVGSEVSKRCQAFGMNVLGYDPLVSDAAAKACDIEPVTLEDLCARSDFITLHCPFTPTTKHLLNADRLQRCKDGVHIVNTSRHQLMDKDALLEALESGKVSGVALDMKPSSHPLYAHAKVSTTPHIGANTTEAQERISTKLASQLHHALTRSKFDNVLNAPNLDLLSQSARPPYYVLAEKLGSLHAQLLGPQQRIVKITIVAQGKDDKRQLLQAACRGLLRHLVESEVICDDVVSVLHARGINLVEHTQEDVDSSSSYSNLVQVTCHLDDGTSRALTGTVLMKSQLRLVQYDALRLDALLSGCMVFFSNDDRPGVLAAVTQVLASHAINIGAFGLGRTKDKDALGVLNLDDVPSEPALAALANVSELSNVRLVNLLDMPLEPRPSSSHSKLDSNQPKTKPRSVNFGSGPCKKHTDYALHKLPSRALGRSHRSALGKSILLEAIEKTKQLLALPPGYVCGIVPASDTGAFEMAMWNLLGPKPVDVVHWDAFGKGWLHDATSQLNLADVRDISAPYGYLPALSQVNKDHDVCFTWNGTTSGVRVPDADWIADDRTGLVLNDATSAAFAMDMPWDKIDVCTFSWQKVLGGEGGHGMLILSPRALDRLPTFHPGNRPMPKIFRLKDKHNEIMMDIFQGSTINTPSMLCVEDYVNALDWAAAQGGVPGLVRKSAANFKVLDDFVAKNNHWVEFLANDPTTRSTTSVCLVLKDTTKDQLKRMTQLLEQHDVAVDIGSYKDAPAGLRIWCGATVETADLEALVPWLEWAHAQVHAE
ncbi:hypothetical protein DYB38_008008 [Aphanomyces astaci]|uniref:phosphoglycerate dehydrogenase n=1 Tax=Aphanomyces astaci TaxID=112090 RepID=A0A397DVL4_APHAT|nr:hypothetical protein DYB38_008008 [Aphanomyces astaci]